MIAGFWFWVVTWTGLLLLGVAGLYGAVYWGTRTEWKNLDEILRASGTVTAASGMLVLLFGVLDWVGEVMLLLALGCFLVAFIDGRRIERERRESGIPERPDDEE